MQKTIKLIPGLCALACAFVCVSPRANAQDDEKRKTIEVTSSFKPSLRTSAKLRFQPAAIVADTSRASLTYNVPVQNLALAFAPAPLRPMALQPDSAGPLGDKVYLKGGFGNFSTPYFNGIARFGNGEVNSGAVEGNFTSSKGKLPYQQFAQYGAKAQLFSNVPADHVLRVQLAFDGNNTYRYGYRPDTLKIPGDSLKVAYNSMSAGLGLSNKTVADAGLVYSAWLEGKYFFDNNDGSETHLKYSLPMEKIINENVAVLVGVQGLISKFSGSTKSYNNNLAVLQVGGKFKLTESISLNASLLPGWNNGEFALLPDIEATIKPATTNLVLQAGWKGYYTEQTWSRLAGLNPWIGQPDTLTHTRNNELFAGVKAVVNEQFSFRIKAGVNIMNYVPLLVNDGYDGRYFRILYEPEMTAVSASGEFTWQQGEKIRWYNALTLNAYSKTDVVEKAAGLFPFEFRSSLRLKLVKSLFLKADLYNFAGTWYLTNASKVEKGKSATDLNAGLEFDITDKLKLWLNLNNILNQKYERWHQYQVLGFQAVGGVVFHL